MKRDEKEQTAKTNNKVDFSRLVPVEVGKKKLGSGAYASVKLVRDSDTDKLYAQKEVAFV